MNKLLLRLQANKLSLNIKKTQIIIFKTRKKELKGEIKAKINDQETKQVESTKFLGIYIDSTLTWKQHINYIMDKI